MGSLSLVTNIGFAHFWLGEETSKLDLVGTILILVGATIAVAFGDHDEQCYTMEELMKYVHASTTHTTWSRRSILTQLSILFRRKTLRQPLGNW